MRHSEQLDSSAKNDVDLQALNKFAGSKSFFACKCGRKCSKYPIFATFLTNLRAKLGRKYLRAYLRAKTAPENHRKILVFATFCDLGGRKYATKIFRSNFPTPGIEIAIASPTGIICIHRRPLHLVVTLVGGILEYGCLGTHISGARCGDRALLETYLRPRKYICGH